MFKWIWNLLVGSKCDTCGRNHRSSIVGVGNSYPSEVIFPGHEYVVTTEDGFQRPEVWRIGFLGTAGEPSEGLLRFTAAGPSQNDDTVTVLIYSNTIRAAREVDIDKFKRHAGRSAIREISRDKQ